MRRALLEVGRPDHSAGTASSDPQPTTGSLDPYQGPAGYRALSPPRPLGGHIDDAVADIVPPISITACRNRHCPRCQTGRSRNAGSNPTPRTASALVHSCQPAISTGRRWPPEIKRSS